MYTCSKRACVMCLCSVRHCRVLPYQQQQQYPGYGAGQQQQQYRGYQQQAGGVGSLFRPPPPGFRGSYTAASSRNAQVRVTLCSAASSRQDSVGLQQKLSVAAQSALRALPQGPACPQVDVPCCWHVGQHVAVTMWRHCAWLLLADTLLVCCKHASLGFAQ
jgi:hypothetical protein